MQETERYNGWKNRATWALNLWLNNEYDLYLAAIANAKANRLEDWVRGSWYEFDTSMRVDVGSDLSGIDWAAIAAGLLEE